MTKVVHTISNYPPSGVDSKTKSHMFTLRKVYEQLATAFNGLINFGNGLTRDNIDGEWVSFVTPGAVNTNFTVTHNLGRIPVGYIIMTKNAACDIYTGTVAGTATQFTLKATVAGVTVNVFFV